MCRGTDIYILQSVSELLAVAALMICEHFSFTSVVIKDTKKIQLVTYNYLG